MHRRSKRRPGHFLRLVATVLAIGVSIPIVFAEESYVLAFLALLAFGTMAAHVLVAIAPHVRDDEDLLGPRGEL